VNTNSGWVNVQFSTKAENVLPKTSKIFCCNPLNKETRQKIRTSLRPVIDWMCDSSHIIEKGMKIFDACRKQLKGQKLLRNKTAQYQLLQGQI
jgi:hypothetical protein